ncbi:hypothetical protein PAAG_12466 [Paracoccidioides lutzii Pb01]|uniref:Uncharacterized protein n=1 Tax=Paracoccidioides lutzii (strain ATCC MYA-826 / Pb01) TaxID=502779 RepID=A0A0A2V3C1_PARBA|nr:hypothetical protein PAAG_12466 [Paracoccidioides lutzii Pb01]KGQ00877.1 hypothetical protein PAAG_12466 [Paracoccidioides lutzii Pb01]
MHVFLSRFAQSPLFTCTSGVICKISTDDLDDGGLNVPQSPGMNDGDSTVVSIAQEKPAGLSDTASEEPPIVGTSTHHRLIPLSHITHIAVQATQSLYAQVEECDGDFLRSRAVDNMRVYR